MLTELTATRHEALYRVEDAASNLRGYIALHSTALGPAAGGLRMRIYDGDAAAIADVLNLSRGMSYKNAAAGLPLGGGKAVIMGDPRRDKTPELLRAMGRAVEALKGRYWTAEDMGMSPEDMAEIDRETDFVAGLSSGEHASGDPSPVTAQGVFEAMQVGAGHVFGTEDLKGRRVAVQGLGHVGWHLCRLVHGAGARLIVADRYAEAARKCADDFGAEIAAPEDILQAEADIFAPCAIGGILNATSIPTLKAKLIAGAANNQLATPEDGDALHARGVLYLPDYVANGGGIINVAAEILEIDDEAWVSQRLGALRETMVQILARAKAEGVSPAPLADRIAEERMAATGVA